MNWPIPNIPHKKVLNPPSKKFWLTVLFVLVGSGTSITIFLFHARTFLDVFINGLLPSLLIWFCFLGVALFRYEQSSNVAILWDIQTQYTKTQWQRWAMWQRPIIANVIICPELKGSLALTGALPDIPAYPQKGRGLHTKFATLNAKFDFLDKEIEDQVSDYRNILYDIVVLTTKNHDIQLVSQAVYRQWDLIPAFLSSADDFFSGKESRKIQGLTLIITLQDWPNSREVEYSEFISAKLICSKETIKSYSLNAQAGIGRFLHSESLTQSLDVLVEYNNLKSSDIKCVWLTGIEEKAQIELAKYAHSNKWSLPPRHPFLVINHSFGPPGPLSFPTSLSLITEAAIQSEEAQLLICGNRDGTYSICLVTGMLFYDGKN